MTKRRIRNILKNEFNNLTKMITTHKGEARQMHTAQRYEVAEIYALIFDIKFEKALEVLENGEAK